MIPGQKLPGGSTNTVFPTPTQVVKEVAFIIDRSGSMSSRIDQVISGFNEYIGDLRREHNPNIRFSMTLFSTNCENRHTSTPLSSVGELNRFNYRPDGCTALLDAVGRTINQLESQAYGKAYTIPHYLVVIMTDGKENASKEYTRQTIRQMISQRQERGNWTFVFLGADQNAWDEAATLGFYKGNVMSYNSNETYGTMRRLAHSTTVRTRGATASTKDFFTDAGDTPEPPTITSTGNSKLSGS